MRELPHTHSCFVCGESNAVGLKLRFETDGHIVRTRFRPQPGHVGFRGVVHGGLVATVLDEIMVWACAVRTRHFAYCADLQVRFLKPVRPGESVIVQGELAANRKGRIYEARADLRAESGETLAEASGKYLPIRSGEAAEMTGDFVGDPGRVWGPET